MAVIGAALASVGAAMLVLGVLDAMGVMRLMGTSPAFLGLCMLLVGGFLVLIGRAESTGDEDEAETTAGGVRRVTVDPEDVFETRSPFGRDVAGRVGPEGTSRSRRGAAPGSGLAPRPASPTAPASASPPAPAPAPAQAPIPGRSTPRALPEAASAAAANGSAPPSRPRAGTNDDGPPVPGAPFTARRRRR